MMTIQKPLPAKVDSPPEYFDVAPDSYIIFPPSYSDAKLKPPPSTAEAEQRRKGIYSHDPILNRNPEELWRFLAANLRPPHLTVRIMGYHTEITYIASEFFPKDVMDFCIEIDISDSIPQWSQIYAHPNGAPIGTTAEERVREIIETNGGGTTAWRTVRGLVEEYTSSRNPFKEFRMRKLVPWDYGRVKKSLFDLVRSTGYSHSIGVRFRMEDYKVVASVSNEYSRFAHSKVVRALCCVSCLWIGCWPAWAIARKRLNLTCEYRSTQSADEFLSRYSDSIRCDLKNTIGGPSPGDLSVEEMSRSFIKLIRSKVDRAAVPSESTD